MTFVPWPTWIVHRDGATWTGPAACLDDAVERSHDHRLASSDVSHATHIGQMRVVVPSPSRIDERRTPEEKHADEHATWHLHTGDQVLYFVSGKGMAQNHDGPVIECAPGDIIHVPPGTRHIHGAMPGHDATHIAITKGDHVWDNEPNYPR